MRLFMLSVILISCTGCASAKYEFHKQPGEAYWLEAEACSPKVKAMEVCGKVQAGVEIKH